MYTQLGLYIDGKWNHGNGGGGEEVINPATEKPLAHLPHASTSDLDAALAAAQKGFQVWKAKSAYERGRIIKKAADLVRERADHIARVMTQEQGKVSAEAKGEVMTSADIAEWFAEEGRRSYGRIIPSRNPDRAPDGRDRAGRRRGGVHAVEFSDAHAGAQDLGRARRRLLDHRQGVGRNARLLRRAGEVLRGRRPAARRAQSRVRRAGASLRAPDQVEHRAQDLVHRLGAGRQASRRARRQGHEARHHGARRPFAGDRVRRRRPGEIRRHHLGLEVSQCRPGLHLADALLRAGSDLRPLPQALHRQRQGDQARRRAGEGHHHGSARQSAPARRDGLVRGGRKEPRRQSGGRRLAQRQPGLSSSSRP